MKIKLLVSQFKYCHLYWCLKLDKMNFISKENILILLWCIIVGALTVTYSCSHEVENIQKAGYIIILLEKDTNLSIN